MSNKKTAIHGAKWTTVSTGFNALLQFIQVAIIARILGPSAFGIVSISTLVITFLSIFVHFGFANSIIYKQENDKKALSTIYYLNIIMGIVMFFLIYLCSPLLIAYYKEPRLAEVLKVSAFYFPIIFLGQIYNTILEKELKFRSLALIDIFTSILGTSITIFLAYRNYQAMALIYGLLAGQLIRMIFQNILGRKYFSPILFFNINTIRDHLKFGVFNVADSVLGFANSNIDTILIGGLLGVKDLGYYTIASQIAVYPVVRICPIIIQVCYPIMAKMKDSLDALKSAYLQIVELISFCIIPLTAGLFIMAAYVIPLIYGPGWLVTIPLIKIFVFMGLVASLIYPISPMVYSVGKPNLLFYSNVLTFAIKFPLVFVLAKYYGIMGVAVGFLISTVISLFQSYYLINYIVGPFFKPYIKNLIKPLAFGLIMVAVILIYQHFISNMGIINTIIQIALGGAIYIGLTFRYKISFAGLRKLL